MNTARVRLLAAVTALATLPAAAMASDYRLVTTIDLPGDKGGHGDWVSYDPTTKTIWLAQAPDHNVVVINTATNTVKGVIADIAAGNVVLTSAKYAFIADGDGNDVVVVDKGTLKPVATMKFDGKTTPDGLALDEAADRLYVTGDDSNDITAYKASPPFTKVGQMALQPDKPKDGPDVPLLVASKHRLYQPDDNLVNVIDTNTGKTVATWTPDVAGDVKPMVYDEKTNHLIAGTTDKKMLVLDADSGAAVASIPLQGGVDETAIDVAARRAFVGDKGGMVEVIDLDTNKIVDTLPSEKNMHTVGVDTDTHRVYVYKNENNKVDVFERITK